MGAWAVAPSAFTPRKVDTDGLSVFREDFVTKESLAEKNPHPAKARVSSIFVVQLRGLELEVKPDPIKEFPSGHSLLPEVKYSDNPTDAERQKIKDNSQKLAQLATENGLYSPPGMPAPRPQGWGKKK
jgi:hypothetical protein